MRACPLLLLSLTLACNGGDDSGADTDTDSDTDADTFVNPGDLEFASYDIGACSSSDAVVRGTTGAEDGHWSAARITPGQDMQVNEVRVHLYHAPGEAPLNCNAATTVAIWVTDASEPPADATPDDTISVPEGSVGENERVLRLVTDLEVAADESVFVAIQMIATSSEATCVRTCSDASGADDNFWSNAADEPFDWATFTDIGIDSTQFMSLHGEAL